MKTAVSLPDELFTSADRLARKLGISRSGLFAAALREFIARDETSRVTERLNAVYAVEDSRLDDWGRAAAKRTLERSEW